MKVLVAGASGFVGQAITHALVAHEANQIMSLSRSDIPSCGPNHQHVSCDWVGAFRHEDVLSFAPQVIINAVGDSHPRNSIGCETALIETNLLPFFQLLDEQKAKALERVVFISSAGALYNSALNSTVKPSSDSAYFSVKKGTEMFLESWCAANDICGVSLRLSNPVGNNKKAGFGVVNHFARALANGDEVSFIGDYKIFKDYIDVRDAGDAISRAATRKLDHSGHAAIDLGSGVAFCAEGIYSALKAIAQDEDVPNRISRASTLDLSGLQKTLGWQPQRNIIQTFAKIYAAQNLLVRNRPKPA